MLLSFEEKNKALKQALRCLYHVEAEVLFNGSNQEIESIKIEPFKEGCKFSSKFLGEYTLKTEEREVFLKWEFIPNFLTKKINNILNQ